MPSFSNSDTICAIATPHGAGGIGVVRVSGPAAFEVLSRVWRGARPAALCPPRKVSLGVALAADGTPVDQAMAVKLPAPHTYTGQDIAEISCHGSQIVLARLLEACVAAGARLAGPGEFTRRAFLAGKMDLAQAEAVCDLIQATGERGARLAGEQLEGRLSREVAAIGARLARLRAEVEGAIDFPEEGIEAAPRAVDGALTALEEEIRRLSGTYARGRLAREGVRVALVGKPNVGKSSLFNRLVGNERAIVHPAPGTTRDVIEEGVSHDGVAFWLRDTAGVRRGAGELEAIGIERTRAELAKADLALALVDGSRPFDREDAELLAMTQAMPAIIVVNKADLPQVFTMPRDAVILSESEGSRWSGGILCCAQNDNEPVLRLSASTGDGLEALWHRLAAFAREASPASGDAEGAVVTSARHRAALGDAAGALRAARKALSLEAPIECLAQDLRRAQDALGSITGEVTTEVLLDQIFSRFCIGK